MAETITVYYQSYRTGPGMTIRVPVDIARALGLRNRQSVQWKTMQEIRKEMDKRKAKNES